MYLFTLPRSRSSESCLLTGYYYPLLQTNHIICSTESSRQALERLWDASVYREFALNRGIDLETSLPTAMKFKLKSKYPFPAEHQGDEDEMEDEAEEPRASGNNNNNSNKKEVKNARLPRSVHEGLNAWLKKHQDHPFPNKEEKEMLSSTLGITPQQVKIIFSSHFFCISSEFRMTHKSV